MHLRYAIYMKSWWIELKRWFYWFCADDDGHIVIWQFPNAPLFIAMAAYLVRIFSSTWMLYASDIVFVLAIGWWAFREITAGDSRFRRVFGVLVLIWVIWSHLKFYL